MGVTFEGLEPPYGTVVIDRCSLGRYVRKPGHRCHGPGRGQHGGADMANRTCSVEGCGKPHAARGWCKTHYYKLRPPVGQCVVDGCTESIQSRGWCRLHYSRWARHGTPTPVGLPWEAEDKAGPLPDLPTDLAVGLAGEHLVMVDLLLAGYRAIKTDQHCPYDVIVELPGRLVRVQVKSVREPTAETRRSSAVYTPAYKWSTRKAGNRGRREYDVDGFDVLALVALDIRRVAYLSWRGQQHVQIPAPGHPARPGAHGAVRRARLDFDQLTFAAVA